MAEETFAERLWEAIDETLEGYDLPSEFGGMLKKDLKDAFDVKGPPRPGYEPGAVGRFRFNLVDAVTQPGKTAWKTFSTVFSERSRPSLPLAWTDAEGDVWNKLFIDPTIGGWVDAAGNPVLPSSLRQATLRWNEGARTRGTRLVREQRGIFENPGLTLMMAQQLNYYHASLPGAPVPMVAGNLLPNIINDAGRAESEITHLLALADNAERAGNRAEAVRLWDEATKRQGDWAELSESYRDAVRGEFERVGRLGSQANAPPAAHALANSTEAKFWRYWKNRRLYFQTLNFLNTYKEKGFWGTAKEYAWNEFTKRAFAEGTWREYLYPPNFIQKKIVQPFAKKIRLTKLLDKLTDWRSRFAGFWKRVVYERVKGWIVKIGAKLGLKVLMAKIGALLGSVVPGVGTAVGAIIGAVASFIVGIVAEKAMMPVLKLAVCLFVGIGGFFVLAAAGMAIFLTFLMGSIFNTNAVLPAAVPPLPPAAQVTVKKESCVEEIIAGVPTWFCQNPRTIGNNTGIHEIKWQITIHNGSDQTAQVVISDTECNQTWRYTSDGEGFLNPGDTRVPNCIKEYNTGPGGADVLNNTTVYNTVTGTAWVGTDTRSISAVGTLYIGTPSSCLLDVPFFCQSDYSAYKCCWQSGPVASCPSGSQDTIAHSGCGCTSETMLVNYYGAATTPPDLCGTYGCTANQGASSEHLGAPLSTRYAPCDSADNYFAVIEAHLCPPNNRPVIALRHNPSWTWGHFAVITGVDPGKREVTLNDPAYFGCTKGHVMGFDEFYAEAARRGCLLYYGPPK